MGGERKVTTSAVGDAYCLIDEFLSKCQKENLRVTGLEFSNLGAQGREPLFDVSYSKTGDIMAYWKDKNRNCIVISAPEPGYEIMAPKVLRHFFDEGKNNYFHPTHLDVTHLDVAKTTDFAYCFRLFGFDFGRKTRESETSKIMGLETWNVSSGKDFGCMFDQAFPQNQSISLNLSSWRFNQETRISFWSMFHRFGQRASKVMLNVSNWNTMNVYLFDQMFENFAPHAKIVEVKGIEDWRLGTGEIHLDYAFDDFAKASDCRLDLSRWLKNCTKKPTMIGFAKGTFFRVKEPNWMPLPTEDFLC